MHTFEHTCNRATRCCMHLATPTSHANYPCTYKAHHMMAFSVDRFYWYSQPLAMRVELTYLHLSLDLVQNGVCLVKTLKRRRWRERRAAELSSCGADAQSNSCQIAWYLWVLISLSSRVRALAVCVTSSESVAIKSSCLWYRFYMRFCFSLPIM